LPSIVLIIIIIIIIIVRIKLGKLALWALALTEARQGMKYGINVGDGTVIGGIIKGSGGGQRRGSFGIGFMRAVLFVFAMAMHAKSCDFDG
jgi:hypothetical protein